MCWRVEITLGFLITLPFVCIDWLPLSLIKSKKVWVYRAPKYQSEQAHSLKFNRFIVLHTTQVTLSSEVSRLKRKRAVFCSVEYRFKIRMSLLVTEIMITFLAGDVCKEDMASGSSSQWTISHNITRLSLSSPPPKQTRFNCKVKKFCLFSRHWIKSISMTKKISTTSWASNKSGDELLYLSPWSATCVHTHLHRQVLWWF